MAGVAGGLAIKKGQRKEPLPQSKMQQHNAQVSQDLKRQNLSCAIFLVARMKQPDSLTAAPLRQTWLLHSAAAQSYVRNRLHSQIGHHPALRVACKQMRTVLRSASASRSWLLLVLIGLLAVGSLPALAAGLACQIVIA